MPVRYRPLKPVNVQLPSAPRTMVNRGLYLPKDIDDIVVEIATHETRSVSGQYWVLVSEALTARDQAARERQPF